MARWDPNARQRLQQAAGALFLERGYADVTVADIADRAGLTKRSFFNHFTDKREVLFADARVFESDVVNDLAAADPGMDPLDAAVQALTHAGRRSMAQYGEYAKARRDLIASSTDLQERDLIKAASLVAAIAGALRGRQAPDRTAAFAAKVAVAVFTAAYDDWTEQPTADLADLMQNALDDVRRTVCRPDMSGSPAPAGGRLPHLES